MINWIMQKDDALKAYLGGVGRLFRIGLCLAGLFFLFCAHLLAETVVFVSDRWEPVNGLPESSLPGYAVELGGLIFSGEGYDFEYHLVPWVRGLIETKRGTYAAVIGATRENAPDLLLPREPFGILDNDFYTLIGSNWVYQGPESLEGERLGIIRGYSYGEIQPYIDTVSDEMVVQRVSSYTPLYSNFKKLIRNRITVLVDWGPVAEHIIEANSWTGQIRHAGGGGNATPLFPGFTPGRTDLAERWDREFRRLREDGTLEEILQKYGLTLDALGLDR